MPGGLDRGVHPLPIFPKQSVSQQWEPMAYFLWGRLPSKLVHVLFLRTLLGEWCLSHERRCSSGLEAFERLTGLTKLHLSLKSHRGREMSTSGSHSFPHTRSHLFTRDSTEKSLGRRSEKDPDDDTWPSNSEQDHKEGVLCHIYKTTVKFSRSHGEFTFVKSERCIP